MVPCSGLPRMLLSHVSCFLRPSCACSALSIDFYKLPFGIICLRNDPPCLPFLPRARVQGITEIMLVFRPSHNRPRHCHRLPFTLCLHVKPPSLLARSTLHSLPPLGAFTSPECGMGGVSPHTGRALLCNKFGVIAKKGYTIERKSKQATRGVCLRLIRRERKKGCFGNSCLYKVHPSSLG